MISETADSGSFMSPTSSAWVGHTTTHAGSSPDVEAVRAEVALLGRVVLRIDEDRVVGARSDARLAADADRLVEVDDAVGTAVHRRGGTRRDARRVVTLVAAGDLERAPSLRKAPGVHVLHVRPGHGERHFVLRLARGRARVATDAPRVVDDLRPHGLGRCVHRSGRRHSGEAGGRFVGTRQPIPYRVAASRKPPATHALTFDPSRGPSPSASRAASRRSIT